MKEAKSYMSTAASYIGDLIVGMAIGWFVLNYIDYSKPENRREIAVGALLLLLFSVVLYWVARQWKDDFKPAPTTNTKEVKDI